MGVTNDTVESITSWTRTLNEEDALVLLDAARPGVRVAEWADLVDGILPQSSPARRRELIKIVRDELLDIDDGVIADGAWLRLFHDGSPHRRLGLLYGRLWKRRPLVLKALVEVVHPALHRADRPLAPLDAHKIELDAWDHFLRRALHPDVPSEAFAKTRSTLLGALRDVGVLKLGTSRDRSTEVQHARPDPLAFAWVLADEVTERGEVPEPWSVRESFAARLFAPRLEYAATCVDAAVSAGLVRRSYLLGQARLQPPAPMPTAAAAS